MSAAPVKNAIDEQLQRLFDSLVSSLRKVPSPTHAPSSSYSPPCSSQTPLQWILPPVPLPIPPFLVLPFNGSFPLSLSRRTCSTRSPQSITRDVASIDAFVDRGSEALSARPQTVEEIGAVNATHAALSAEKAGMQLVFPRIDGKNRLLRCVVLLAALTAGR